MRLFSIPATERSALATAERPKSGWPVAIFSHGLGGNRTTYSKICTDLASHGYVVAAIEHGDGTASVSMRGDGSIQWYQRLPKDIDEWTFRNTQLEQRIAEVSSTIDFLANINQGTTCDGIGGDDSRKTEIQEFFSEWKGCLDLSTLSVVGHSMGGATAVGSGHRDQRLTAVVALDTWMFPLSKEMLSNWVNVKPICFINSDTFQWKKNLDAMHQLVMGSAKGNSGSEDVVEVQVGDHKYLSVHNRERHASILTLKGTAHQNQSDFPLLAQSALKMLRMSGSVDAHKALTTNNEIILEFLNTHLGNISLEESKVVCGKKIANNWAGVRVDFHADKSGVCKSSL